MRSDERPIGVFDSGVGGLSVLRAIRDDLPAEDILYVADSGYAPYGDKPREFIEQRAIAIVEFLLRERVKAVVVACNTATGAAVDTLRTSFALPIVAMEPAVKPAAATTRSGVVGILATTQTLASSKFMKLVDAHSSGARLLVQPCPGLVDLVEEGDVSGARARALVERYVRPLLEQDADTLVLGCTHYPFLRPIIQELAGPAVSLIDPAVAVARELRRRLDASGLLRGGGHAGTERFWSSGSLPKAHAIIEQLWRRGAEVSLLPGGP
jgi:glutamate racemase